MTIDMENKLEQYKWFFGDQLHQMQQEQQTLMSTPVCALLKQGLVTMGYVEKVIPSTAHVVVKFPIGYAPRMKTLKSFVVIKKEGFTQYGAQLKNWTCSLESLLHNIEAHSSMSEIMPLHYLPSNDGYDHVECASVSIKLYELLQKSSAAGKSLTVFVFDPYPPIDYLYNLKQYIDLFPENPELMLQPKIEYEEWHPNELCYSPEKPNAIASTVFETLERNACCILQGPPGTGKTYVIASIIADYLKQGKTVCATTMANKGLMELILQEPLKPFLNNNKIFKTNISSDELAQAPELKAAPKGLVVPCGELLCSTNYVLSGIFGEKNLKEFGIPDFDLVVIEEASQAFLTAIAAFKSLGKRCLIVGDPMQLPPIVKSLEKAQYKMFNVATQIEGLKTFALGTDFPSFRIITTFRLSANSAKLTGLFYDRRLRSVNPGVPDFSKISSPFLMDKGGVIYHTTSGFTNAICSNEALVVIGGILDQFSKNYPDAEIAVITPFIDSAKKLQKHYMTPLGLKNLTIETVDRIQGMTVDYAIYYIPGRKPSFALDEKRFNVATSRSRGTTLLLCDMPLEQMHTASGIVQSFVENCARIQPDGTSTIMDDSISETASQIVPEKSNYREDTTILPGVKVLDKIDLSQFETKKQRAVKSETKKNIYIIDTNVFVNCPDIISKIVPRYSVILSAKVIDELDHLKIKLDADGKRNVEKALKNINNAMDKPNVSMELSNPSLLPADFDKRSPDNNILTVALKHKNENPILLTSDNGLQVKAKGLNINTISLKDFLKR